MWGGYVSIGDARKRFFIHPENIYIGEYVSIGKESYLYASENSKIEIENGVILARRIAVRTTDHRYDSKELRAVPYDEVNYVGDIKIGEATWIGEDSVILPGVSIGRGCVIGTHSVVTHDIPDYAVACGVPAKVIKYRDKDIFERLAKEKKYSAANKEAKKYVVKFLRICG